MRNSQDLWMGVVGLRGDLVLGVGDEFSFFESGAGSDECGEVG